MRMWFGKYRGFDMGDVPDDYLVWALDHLDRLSPTQREVIRVRLGLPPSDTQSPRTPDDVDAVVGVVMNGIQGVYRELAVKYHPDRGGSAERMIAVNSMYDRLREVIPQQVREVMSLESTSL